MYQSVLVPVDNSDFSNQAVETAIQIGKRFGSKVTGNHVYAASMHDYRFRQMEFTLPEEYRQESEIERQRKIHDSLITMGLKLISDCYLNVLDLRCQDAGLECERKMMDGKHHVEILKDMAKSDYDLTVLGAKGIGKTKDMQIGPVCQTVARHGKRDIWVVKHVPGKDDEERDTILVGIDGSPHSFGCLMTAAELAKQFDKKITLISVYDPYLHYLVFNSIVDVLTEKAAKVFRFEEQNQLHEEIIDTGLAQIYQSHLDVAGKMLQEKGLTAEKVLLDGKAFQKILDYTRKNPPWLLVMGRIGVHSESDEPGLGSNTESLLRLAPCDVLLGSVEVHPELDKKAEESILWTQEAEERMTRVPDMVKGIARTGILRLAVEQGHSVITNSVIDDAMERFMPKRTSEATIQLAESLAFDRARRGKSALCKHCGTTATEENPVKCSVCGASEFDFITEEIIEKIVASEGGANEETTYDGRKLVWTREARKLLPAIKDNYQKRRAKAYIEKAARMRRLNTVTAEFAEGILEELGHEESLETHHEAQAQASGETDGFEEEKLDYGLKLVARDAKGNPLNSVFAWTPEAVERLLRVPHGFMRDKVQERVESLALDNKMLTIDLDLVEQGIEIGRKLMEEMLAAQSGNGAESSGGNRSADSEGVPKVPASDVAAGGCPFQGAPKSVLNEAGIMAELEKARSK